MLSTQQIRNLGGLLVLCTLLILILGNAWFNTWVTASRDIPLLISLITALLGVDILVDNRDAVEAALYAYLDSKRTEDETETDRSTDSKNTTETRSDED